MELSAVMNVCALIILLIVAISLLIMAIKL